MAILGSHKSRSGSDFSLAGVAGPAGLGASTQGESILSNPPGLLIATAQFAVGDMVISGPSGGFVEGSLNLHLSGSLGINFASSADIVGSYVQIGGQLAGLSFDGFVNPCNGSCGGPTSVFSHTGILASVTGSTSGITTIDGIFVTPTVSLPVNTPFSLSLSLTTGANAFSSGTSAFANFLNTLTFQTGGPVFNLPAGYTINSADGGILNNRFDVSSVPGVPLPGGALLLASGLAGMLGIGARRRRGAVA